MTDQYLELSPTSRKKVFVIVINWNDIDSTLKCVDSLFKSTYPEFQVVVIDNGSEQDPGDILTTKYPEIIYIRNDENKGFTGANNQGMELAIQNGAEFVWLVNNDAAVGPDALMHLVECLQTDDQLGLVSPTIVDMEHENGTYYGSFIDIFSLTLLNANSLDAYFKHLLIKKKTVCFWGTALFIRTEAIRDVGFFDDRFFAYYEDIDFSLRLQKKGWKNTLCTASKIFHPNIRTNRPEHYYYYMTRNKYLLDNRHSQSGFTQKNHASWFLRSLKQAAAFRNSQKMRESNAIMNGTWHALTNQYGAYENKKPIPTWMKSILLWLPYILARVISLK